MEQKAKRIPTAKEVLARQKADHEKPSQLPAKTKPGEVVTAQANPWLQVGGALAAHLGERRVKFSKQGDYALNDVDQVPIGTKCVAHVNELEFGYIKWRDNAVVDRRGGRVADGYVPPPRAELGDLDQSEWELEPGGKPRDPWQFQGSLPLTRLDNDEQLVFATTSKGGLGAVGKLMKSYGKRVAAKGDATGAGLPIIELGSSSYKHPVYSKIFVPVLTIVNWTGPDGMPLSLSDDMDDGVDL